MYTKNDDQPSTMQLVAALLALIPYLAVAGATWYVTGSFFSGLATLPVMCLIFLAWPNYWIKKYNLY
jgi:hypothetical protein